MSSSATYSVIITYFSRFNSRIFSAMFVVAISALPMEVITSWYLNSVIWLTMLKASSERMVFFLVSDAALMSTNGFVTENFALTALSFFSSFMTRYFLSTASFITVIFSGFACTFFMMSAFE